MYQAAGNTLTTIRTPETTITTSHSHSDPVTGMVATDDHEYRPAASRKITTVFERVLITGAAGFIGSHLAEHYLRTGADVYGIDCLITGDWSRNYPTNDAGWVTLDIRHRWDFYKVANMFQPDLVIHCAASYSDPDMWHRDSEINVGGSINAALVAKYHGAKLIYFNTALPPISSYAISKIAGWHYIHLALEDALTFRLANVYGPRNLSGPIPTFYKKLKNGDDCTVTRTKRELVYINDLVEGVTRITAAGATGTIDMCTGSPVRIKDVYKAVSDAVGVKKPAEEIDPPADDVKMMELDPSKAKALGWEASTAVPDGVFEACRWYSEHGVGSTYTHLRIK